MIKAEIVAHSLSPQGDELISVLCTFPRIILAEVNTHRMLSKNTSSSRAIPFKKMVKAVEENPFIPIAWQKEHKGMQGSEYIIDNLSIQNLNNQWLKGRDEAIKVAQGLNKGAYTLEVAKDEQGNIMRGFTLVEIPNTSVTKQLCNRLLEPFMWTTMLITGSKEGWDNFFHLRCPDYIFHDEHNEYHFKSKKDVITKFGESEWVEDGFDKPLKNLTELDWLHLNKGQAEIHMMALSEAIYDAVNESTPKQLKAGEWHIPFAIEITDLYIKNKGYVPETEIPIDEFVKISTAMAAHTSYTIVGGEAVKSYEKWIELHDKLIAYDPPHSSPMEHCAKAMNDAEYESFYKGQIGLGGESGWCNNLKGFIPYRYFIDNNLI